MISARIKLSNSLPKAKQNEDYVSGLALKPEKSLNDAGNDILFAIRQGYNDDSVSPSEFEKFKKQMSRKIVSKNNS